MKKELVSRIVDENGKKRVVFEWVKAEDKPVWGDGWRNSHKTNPTEKAPSFKAKW